MNYKGIEYSSLFEFRNDKEHLDFQTDRIQLDILAFVSDVMNEKNISRSNLAEMLRVSKSYVSQLFSCDKRLNLKTIAQLELVLDVRLIGYSQDTKKEVEGIPDFFDSPLYSFSSYTSSGINLFKDEDEKEKIPDFRPQNHDIDKKRAC